jgi:dihydrofolate reductase
MAKLRVHGFGVSLDGFGAGPKQSLENPLGVNGTAIFQWFFGTRTFCAMHGGEGGTTGVDDEFAARGFENVGAWILGRNMFGPVRGPWPDESWRGWWGDEPPYHVPAFVLTHYARNPLEMKGGTTFYFVTGGIEEALTRAFEAAQGKDVRLGGGVATIRQFLSAGLIDELHLAFAYTLLGKGESLFEGINLPALGYEVTAQTPTDRALHVTVTKKNL